MDLSRELNVEQLKAATHVEGPLLVLAGAGSGKTRVVAYRIAYLIEKGIEPHQILAVTFTNKAAGEMLERIRTLLGRHSIYSSPIICTFHSLGVRILRESIHYLGYQPNFTIYDEEDSNKLLKSCLLALNVKKEVEFKTFRNYISYAKNQLQEASELDLRDLPSSLQAALPVVYAMYLERLKEANALDFDDLLFLPVKLFRHFPAVLSDYQSRWPFFLIDEYQDTNHAQYWMARLIVGENRNIFVVGDPDQSIYSWRGANIQNILNFEKDYPGAKIVRLEQNYRSRKTILDAANTLIQNNCSRYEKHLWSNRGAGEKITLFIGGTEREEAGFVVHEIERLNIFHQVTYNEMTIFYRTNFQSRIFEDFLLRKKIPYTIVGGLSFYQRKEIKDILSFLHVLNSDQDFISFERTINLPKRGLGLITVQKIVESSSLMGLPIIKFSERLVTEEGIGQIRLSSKQKEGLRDYFEIIKNLRELKKNATLEKLVIETVRQTRYLEVLKEDKETFEDRKANLDELVSKAHEWEMFNDSTALDLFLEELTLKSSLDEARFSSEKVNLMTLHNGKGLEFDTAFLVGMEEDLFPHANSKNDYEAIEEERRLCYVGMTRAKERLYLTAAETRFIWGSHRMMRPSRFLREIPKEFVDRYK
jgi:DNA helicase II / ATP-dependent DNA helicase PcrA